MSSLSWSSFGSHPRVIDIVVDVPREIAVFNELEPINSALMYEAVESWDERSNVYGCAVNVVSLNLNPNGWIHVGGKKSMCV